MPALSSRSAFWPFFGVFVAGAVLDFGQLGFDGLRREFLQLRVDGRVNFEAALVGLLVAEQRVQFAANGGHGVIILHARGGPARLRDVDGFRFGLCGPDRRLTKPRVFHASPRTVVRARGWRLPGF